jgi:hypothetical protein
VPGRNGSCDWWSSWRVSLQRSCNYIYIIKQWERERESCTCIYI